jgi:hypothetical protein
VKRTFLPRTIAALGLVVTAAWGAQAQSEPPATAPEIERAAAQDWFLEYIQPSIDLEQQRNPEVLLGNPPELFDANVPAPAPVKPPPDRRLYVYRPKIGNIGLVVQAGDLPPTRSEWADARDWHDNDFLRPELFRFYFEPRPAPAN